MQDQNEARNASWVFSLDKNASSNHCISAHILYRWSVDSIGGSRPIN